MKLKDWIKIYKNLKTSTGCLIITKNNIGAVCNIIGDYTIKDLEKYTKGFNND